MPNPLCPIIGLLTLAPHPLSVSEVASTLGLQDHDVAMALALLGAAGRVRVVNDRWAIVPSATVLSEAISALRSQARAKWVADFQGALERVLEEGEKDPRLPQGSVHRL